MEYQLLFLYLFVAVGFSFLCSLLEASFLSTKESYVLTLKGQGDKSANIFEKLLEKKDESISSILTINTFAHTLGAAGVGAQAAKIFGESAMVVISIILTFIILIGSEIIPKTIGATYWKQLFGFTSKTLKFLNIICTPTNKFLTLFTRFMKKPEDVVTKDEVLTNVQMSLEDGVLDDNEANVMKNMLELKKIMAKDVMTPRKMISSLNEDDIVKNVKGNKDIDVHSRILLEKDNKDDIDSYILKHDLLQAEDNTKLKTLEKNILTVSHEDNLSFVLSKFLETKEHIFLVIDEYEQVDGIITMEDVFETLIGVEIMDETDKHEDLAQLAKEQKTSK